MSQIRQVKVKIKDIASIKEACESLGMIVENNLIKNHGIKTWGLSDLQLRDMSDGSYNIVGDCSQKDLENLNKKIKSKYDLIMTQKAAKKLGFSISSSKKVGNKTKLTLQIFN